MSRGLLVALALFSAPIWGADETEVVVIGAHLSDRSEQEVEQITDKLVSIVDHTQGLAAVGPAMVSTRLRGRGVQILDDALAGAGRQRLAEGRVLFERAEMEGAVESLQSAVRALETSMAGATDGKDLLEALLLLGMVQLSMGENDGARATYKRVVILDPDWVLNSVHYPPKAVSLFEQVRSEVLAVPRGALRIRTAEQGAAVFVDGRLRGEGSIEVNGLVPGAHHVLVTSSSGYRSYVQVMLGPQQRQTISAPMNRRFMGVAGTTVAERSMQTEALYRGVGSAVPNGLVLLGGQTGDGEVSVQLLEPRTGNISKPLVDRSGGDAESALLELTGQIGAFVSEAGTLRSDSLAGSAVALDLETNPVMGRVLLQQVPLTAPSRHEPRAKRKKKGLPWYVWAGMGVMAAGATGMAFAFQPKKGGSTGGGGGSTDGDGDGRGGQGGQETRKNDTGTVLVPIPG